MIQNTFCHLKKIGLKKEAAFWNNGIFSWGDLLRHIKMKQGLFTNNQTFLEKELTESFHQFGAGSATYFADRLTSSSAWRLFPDFRHCTAYVDIETNGMNDPEITTIALYDGKHIRYYVNGQNLEQFQDDILNYRLLITYNGKTFDIPIIENFFRIRLPHAQIDLRYVLKSLGYTGGLKRCEQQLGISRGALDGVDGYFAVLLWHEYCRNRNIRALETLLSYNIADVVNLEKLMIVAFNKKAEQIQGLRIRPLEDPVPPEMPFIPDRALIDQINHSTRISIY